MSCKALALYLQHWYQNLTVGPQGRVVFTVWSGLTTPASSSVKYHLRTCLQHWHGGMGNAQLALQSLLCSCILSYVSLQCLDFQRNA